MHSQTQDLSEALDPNGTIPLCVDLDGTLLATDLLLESAVHLLRDGPWLLFVMPFWALKGRAYLKRRLAERVILDPSSLPFNSEFLDWLRAERLTGRTIVLATAADGELARDVASHLNIFDTVIASDGETNVKGKRKLEILQERFGASFDYAGNSSADLPIWEACSSAIVVNASRRTEEAAGSRARVQRVFRTKRNLPKLLVRQIRVHQWMKNLLVFVALLTSHKMGHANMLFKAVLAFFAFSFTASSVYVINDASDLESDRHHLRKRRRPFASGDLPLTYAFFLAPGLLVLGFALAALTSLLTVYVLAAYFAFTLLYSFWLKRELLIDVFSLAALYTIRIIAGRAAYGTHISAWLLSFSMFVFLSLGFCKRAAELHQTSQRGAAENKRRAYLTGDLPLVNIFGVASGFCASLVLTLYLNSEDVRLLYKQPDLLWLVFPVLLYWISRIWILTFRGEMHEDPVMFAAKDRVTAMVAVVTGLLMFLATRSWFKF